MMLPLRYARRWQVAGILVLAAVLAAALLPAAWLMSDLRMPRIVPADKWLHAITFAFLTVWFSGQYPRGSYWRLVAGMLAFGALIEICQRTLDYRDSEVLDLVADAVGIAAGLCVALIGVGGWSLRLENWLQLRQSQ